MVTFGFFSTKSKSEEDAFLKKLSYEKELTLRYDERIEMEIPKIRVDLSLKAGSYLRSDRCTYVPEFIIDIAKEFIKVRMFVEQSMLKDPNVMDSLKDFKNPFEQPQQQQIEQEEEEILNVDFILDKINSSGISSLTPNELKFLEKKSRS